MKQIILKNGQELVINKAQIADAQALIAYTNQVGGESDNLTFGKNQFFISVEDEIKLLQDMDQGSLIQIFCGKIDGQIVASCNAGLYAKQRLSHQAAIGITVRKDKWNLGIGKAMLQYLIAYLKARKDIKVVYLEVRSDNKNAIALYNGLGFVKTGVRKDFLQIDGKYYDADFMELYLS